MNKTYKYIKMVQTEQKAKTKVFDVINLKSEDILGEIKWFSHWRQYVFYPYDAIFSKGCLLDIVDFLSWLEDERIREN